MKWEYKILEVHDDYDNSTRGIKRRGELRPNEVESELNALGEDGWELVGINIMPDSEYNSGFRSAGFDISSGLWLFLKRASQV